MPTEIETIFDRLHLLLHDALTPDVLRNAVLPEKIASVGLVILRDGEGDETGTTLSPLTYEYTWLCEVEIYVQTSDDSARILAADAIRSEIGQALNADPMLSGLCDFMRALAPRVEELPIPGGQTIKATLVPIELEFGVANPLT